MAYSHPLYPATRRPTQRSAVQVVHNCFLFSGTGGIRTKAVAQSNSRCTCQFIRTVLYEQSPVVAGESSSDQGQSLHRLPPHPPKNQRVGLVGVLLDWAVKDISRCTELNTNFSRKAMRRGHEITGQIRATERGNWRSALSVSRVRIVHRCTGVEMSFPK